MRHQQPHLGTADKVMLAFTIASFCVAHGISRPTYHRLQKAGRAPAEIRLGRRVLISAESAAAWRAQLEGSQVRLAA